MLKRSIDLNMNEMPYPPPENVVRAAQTGLLNLNRYAEQKDLKYLIGLLAHYSGVPEEHIVLSPGSDLLLREIVNSFSGNRKVVMVSPSFLPTFQAAKQFATKLVDIRLSPPGFGLNQELLLGEVKAPALVIIDNPNNPTGKILLEQQTVEAVLDHEDTLLIIDEAYFEFSRMTFAHLVPSHPNLAITRTMDKAFSLAGARIGYLIAGKYFLNVFSSFPAFLSQSSLHAAIEALNSTEYMQENVRRIAEEKGRLQEKIKDLGTSAYSSSANFLLIKTEIPEIFLKLENIGVLVADMAGQLAPGFIRVSVGTREENDAFINGYRRILETQNEG